VSSNASMPTEKLTDGSTERQKDRATIEAITTVKKLPDALQRN